MKKFKGALLGTLLLAAACAGGNMFFAGRAFAALPEAAMSKWNKLTEMLDEATILRGKRDRLPESSWLGADKQKTNEKIKKVLRDAQEILLSADAMKLVDRSEVIKKRLPELYAEIEHYKNKRIGAPDKSYNPFTDTVADCDKKIAKAEKDIKRLNRELRDIRDKIAAELRSWGMKLTDQQAEVLFSSVVGDSLLKNAVIFENVKGVTQQIAELMAQNKADTTVARKYYGMYVTLIDVLLDSQYGFIDKIDKEWAPRVQSISEGASASLKEARAGLTRQDFTREQKNILRANAESNELTVKAAGQYSKLLSMQKASVEKCIRSIKRDREVAVNTYSTVQHISDMDTVIHSGLQLFDVLATMQLPEIQIFDNSGVRKEFDEITKRLQQGK